MKYIYITVVFFLSSCEPKQGNKQIINRSPDISLSKTKESSDTAVGIINVPAELSPPNYSEKKYFLIIAGDTSNVSFITALNKKSGQLSGRITSSNLAKNFRAENFADTNAVSINPVVGETEDKYFESDITLSQLMAELRFMLPTVSKVADLQKLNLFGFLLKKFRISRLMYKNNFSSNTIEALAGVTTVCWQT